MSKMSLTEGTGETPFLLLSVYSRHFPGLCLYHLVNCISASATAFSCLCNDLYIRKKNVRAEYFKARLCGQLKPGDLQLCLCIDLGGRKLVRSHILIRLARGQ